MFLYALIFPIISIIAIIWFIGRYLNNKNSLSTVILWSIFWIFVSLFAIFPDFSNAFARIFGILEDALQGKSKPIFKRQLNFF